MLRLDRYLVTLGIGSRSEVQKLIRRGGVKVNGLPVTDSLMETFNTVTKLLRSGAAVSAYTLGMGGAAEAVMKMAYGNSIGFKFCDKNSVADLFG